MACKLCEIRGKTWKGSDPRCAFVSGVFSSDNWNCATMGAIRKAVANLTIACSASDCNGILMPVFECGEFLLLTWYKSRGRTDTAQIVKGSVITPLTEAEAEVIVEQLHRGLKEVARPEEPASNPADIRCPRCGHDMEPTGVVFYTCPLRHEYRCSNCDNLENLVFDTIRVKEIINDSGD